MDLVGPRATTGERQSIICLSWFLRPDCFYRWWYCSLRADGASYASMWTGRLCGCSTLPINRQPFSSPFVNPWNKHDGLATPPACVIMHDVASFPCNWLRPSYRFHSNVGRSPAPPRHLLFRVLGRLHVSTGLWLTSLLCLSNYCMCTNDIIPYEWFWTL